MLERFWRIIAPFEDEELNVQIVEKNTEELQTRNDNSGEQDVIEVEEEEKK